MTASTRTSHRQGARTAAIQTRSMALDILSNAAAKTLDAAKQKAFNQGLSDFENSTRDHPPYGFSDLKQAWRLGWLAGQQKRDRER